eukprot:SAG31_NODE_567_length_14028_cov_4.022328_16_plen_83_part_00
MIRVHGPERVVYVRVQGGRILVTTMCIVARVPVCKAVVHALSPDVARAGDSSCPDLVRLENHVRVLLFESHVKVRHFQMLQT